MVHTPFLLVITAMPVTTVMFILAVILYFFWHTMKKVIVVGCVVIGIYYVANERLPWSTQQSKKVVKSVTRLFKEDKK